MKRLIASALTILFCVVLYAAISADDPPINYPPPPPGYVGTWPPPDGFYIDGGDTVYVPTDSTTEGWPWIDPGE